MTTTPLPPPGEASIEHHVQMSRRFLEHARNELRMGNRLQASEKVWGAAAHALKAIGMQRGWNHRSHANVNAIGEHLTRECHEPDFARYLLIANAMHRNFYENDAEEDTIEMAIDDAGEFVTRLDEVRASPPRPYTVTDQADQRRLTRLLGLSENYQLPIGAHSSVGFSKTHSETL